MSSAQNLVGLMARQASQASATAVQTAMAAATSSPPRCESGNDYDGRLGIRVSAIFVILIGSTLGALFPVFASRHRGLGVPEWAFFLAKYFGSGVIIATAFIHLLAPANDALKDPCLTGPITDYDWVEGIALMTIFVLFFIELMVMRYASFGDAHAPGSHQTGPIDRRSSVLYKDKLEAAGSSATNGVRRPPVAIENDEISSHGGNGLLAASHNPAARHTPGEDHLSHAREHHDNENNVDQTIHNQSSATFSVVPTAIGNEEPTMNLPPMERSAISSVSRQGGLHEAEDYAAQMTAIFILEFGVIFHSIFIGLTLAVSGQEFDTLYVVLVFHQTFEGLGLGSRLAATPWPAKRRWTPYMFALAYGLTTPIAIAIGLGVRTSYAPGSQRALIVNGCFDSISAGILLYTGLVELMAHEFMFNTYMRRARIQVVLSAFLIMCLGAGLMALLGKWA